MISLKHLKAAYGFRNDLLSFATTKSGKANNKTECCAYEKKNYMELRVYWPN